MYTIADEKIIGNGTDSSGMFSSLKLMEIRCDTSADIPTPEPNWAVGSACFIIDTQDVKFLNSQGEWV